MFEALLRARSSLLAPAERSLAVPVFDGPYTPNTLLEDALIFFEGIGLEDMAIDPDGSIFAACGQEVLRIDQQGKASIAARFDAPLQALALRPSGGIAVALADRVLFDGGTENGKSITGSADRPLVGVNALHSGPDGKLLISVGSTTRPYCQWSHDLLEHGRSGHILEYDPDTDSTRVVAEKLAYCFGVCAVDGNVIASETWAHRIVQVGSAWTVLLDALPGYPARFCRAADGGYWLSLFAGRTQLLEFILQEDDFRQEMMRTLAPEHWYAPALTVGRNFLAPQQTAGVMQMGITKPWAPPRSYGLVVRLNAQLQPQFSLHSRVGGRNHGVVALAEHGEHLFVLSKGSGRILRLPLCTLESDLNARDIDP